MKQETQNLYEGMYIISPSLSEDSRNKALEKIKNGIAEQGGQIEKIHNWGRRRMAYDIAGHRDGYYFLIYFLVKPSAISELWKEYHLNEDLLRFLTLQAEKIMEKIEFKTLIEEE